MSVAATAIPWAPDWVCGVEAPDWVRSGTTDAAPPSAGDDLVDCEEIGILESQDSPYPLALPENAIEKARAAGAPRNQVQQAEELAARDLKTKAQRQALCGVFGRRCDCSNTACRFRGYRPFRCKNRYCPGECGRLAFNTLFKKYLGLLPIVEKLAGGRGRVIAKLDFTAINPRRMPTGEEVKAFNACIKRLCRALERVRGLKRADYGLLYCDEFGFKNTNLHAHAVYVGPVIPRQWFGKGKKLSEMWEQACRGTVFEGSRIISAKEAGGFERGLGTPLNILASLLARTQTRSGSPISNWPFMVSGEFTLWVRSITRCPRMNEATNTADRLVHIAVRR